jgi:hypothetical protein
MESDQLAALAENIRAHGLQYRIVLFEGRILDGRNRYRACQLAGVEPHTRDFPADGDPLAFVLSANLHRRHLTTSQRALLAAKIASLPHGGTNKKQGINSSLAPSIAQAAEKLSVGTAIVKKARTVLQDPAQTRAVESGERSVHAAVQQIRAAHATRSTPATPRDPTGFAIPEALHPLWNRRTEVQTVLTHLSRAHQALHAARESRDPLFERTNLSDALSHLDTISASVARSLPFAVCHACHGDDFETCPTCEGRGFLPETAFEQDANPNSKNPTP